MPCIPPAPRSFEKPTWALRAAPNKRYMLHIGANVARHLAGLVHLQHGAILAVTLHDPVCALHLLTSLIMNMKTGKFQV